MGVTRVYVMENKMKTTIQSLGLYIERAFNEWTGIGTWWYHFTVVLTQPRDDSGMHQLSVLLGFHGSLGRLTLNSILGLHSSK